MCTATTRAEWETLEGMGTGAPSDWFPNGVDSEYFAPTDAPYDPDRIVFVGRMDYYPNQQCMFEFCANVMPRLRARRPAVTLAIVGADPTPAVRKLGEQPGVIVTGSVPDVRPYLREAALMVAPLSIARGTQNKILEGMAAGVPVVTSPAAAGGVDARAPDHLLVASSPAACAEAILRVLDDAQERARLAAAGRARMLSHHAWPHSMRRLDAIVERCLALPRGARRVAPGRAPATAPRINDRTTT
jgi:sugar transferase (PEP-CTERM/EpsH1 system associated)